MTFCKDDPHHKKPGPTPTSEDPDQPQPCVPVQTYHQSLHCLLYTICMTHIFCAQIAKTVIGCAGWSESWLVVQGIWQVFSQCTYVLEVILLSLRVLCTSIFQQNKYSKVAFWQTDLVNPYQKFNKPTFDWFIKRNTNTVDLSKIK